MKRVKNLKNSPILVRATQEERAKIKIKAAEKELSLSRFAVEKCLSDEPFRSRTEKELLRQILFELRKSGNNLNQIAHSFNLARLKNSSPPTEAEIKNATKSIRNLIEAVKTKL
jgi:hypothetical protein